jgi:hypothetical protein
MFKRLFCKTDERQRQELMLRSLLAKALQTEEVLEKTQQVANIAYDNTLVNRQNMGHVPNIKDLDELVSHRINEQMRSVHQQQMVLATARVKDEMERKQQEEAEQERQAEPLKRKEELREDANKILSELRKSAEKDHLAESLMENALLPNGETIVSSKEIRDLFTRAGVMKVKGKIGDSDLYRILKPKLEEMLKPKLEEEMLKPKLEEEMLKPRLDYAEQLGGFRGAIMFGFEL